MNKFFVKIIFGVTILQFAFSLVSMEAPKELLSLKDQCLNVLAGTEITAESFSKLPMELVHSLIQKKISNELYPLDISIRYNPILELKSLFYRPVASIINTDQGVLIVSDDMNDIRISNSQGEQLMVLKGHTGRVTCLSTFYTDRDWLIVSGSADGTVRVWNMQGQQLLKCVGQAKILSAILVHTNEGLRIISGQSDKTIQVWDMEGTQTAICDGQTRGGASPHAFTNSIAAIDTNEGWRIVSCIGEYKIEVFDMQCQKLYSWSTDIYGAARINAVAVAHTHKGPIIIGACNDSIVRIYDIKGDLLKKCEGHSGSVTAVAVRYTNEGLRIVSGSFDKIIRVWDENGNQFGVCIGHSDQINSVVTMYNTDTSFCILSTDNDKIKLWSIFNKSKISCISQLDAFNILKLLYNLDKEHNRIIKICPVWSKEVTYCNLGYNACAVYETRERVLRILNGSINAKRN